MTDKIIGAIQWVVSEFRRTTLFLVLMLALFPVVTNVVQYLESRGFFETPQMTVLKEVIHHNEIQTRGIQRTEKLTENIFEALVTACWLMENSPEDRVRCERLQKLPHH